MQGFEWFYLIKAIHEPLAWGTFLLVILSDLYGGTWVLGWQNKLNKKVLEILHILVYVGLGSLIATGLSMVALNSEEFLGNYIFWAKMFFVTILFWNAGRIGKEVKLLTEKTFRELQLYQKKHVMIVGATSIISWISVLILATSL